MKRYFATNEFYHLYDRGVEKRKIFLDKSDYLRFIHDLYEFNDKRPAVQFSRHSSIEGLKKAKNVGSRTSNIRAFQVEGSEAGKVTGSLNKRKGGVAPVKKDKRDRLLDLHAFVLMPNHHHLLVEQIEEGGVSSFMRKLHTGYTNAFNLKYKRKGHLFQGPFKHIHIKDDVYFGFLICYLHSNPLDLWKHNWKEKKLTDSEIRQALKFLEKYRWSSHLDYWGIKNFPSLISKDFLLEFFDGTEGYKKFFIDWLSQYKKNIEYIREFIK